MKYKQNQKHFFNSPVDEVFKTEEISKNEAIVREFWNVKPKKKQTVLFGCNKCTVTVCVADSDREHDFFDLPAKMRTKVLMLRIYPIMIKFCERISSNCNVCVVDISHACSKRFVQIDSCPNHHNDANGNTNRKREGQRKQWKATV